MNEELHPLPHTEASVLVREDGIGFRNEKRASVVFTKTHLIDFYPYFAEPSRRLHSVIPRNQYTATDYADLETCYMSEGQANDALVARVPNAVTYAHQCFDLREVYNRSARFVSPESNWWLPTIIGWVVDCREFMSAYGAENTPRDLLACFDLMETRLFGMTDFPGAKLDYASPTGSYAVIFGSKNVDHNLFTFSTAEFCPCEACMCRTTLSYRNVVETRLALDPSTHPDRRKEALCHLNNYSQSLCHPRDFPTSVEPDEPPYYIKHGRVWHAADDVDPESVDVGVFETASMHVAHWLRKGEFDHALIVGPLNVVHHTSLTYLIRHTGIDDRSVSFVRNDLFDRNFSLNPNGYPI